MHFRLPPSLSWLSLIASLALAGPAPSALGQDRSGPATWYAQALARGDAGLNVSHFWSKGPMLRAETVVAGHKIVTIVRGDTYYAYDGLTGRGVAIRRDPAAVAHDAAGKRPFGDEFEILIEQGAEQVREEEIMGRATGVYRITDDQGRRELWVTLDDTRIPLRVEIYDRSSTQRRVTDYLNWLSDFEIPDAFFEPDPKARLEKLDFRDYLKRSAETGPVGPVPVFYSRLLYVRRADTDGDTAR